jgi:hypothetical protein
LRPLSEDVLDILRCLCFRRSLCYADEELVCSSCEEKDYLVNDVVRFVEAEKYVGIACDGKPIAVQDRKPAKPEPVLAGQSGVALCVG